MTIPEAKTIVENYYQKNGNNTEEECFLLTEALSFLIHETNNSRYMVQLGGFYYYQKNYELALKYYTMAAELGNESAVIGLGYIWYYGRTGIVDYEKAYKYFSKVEGDPVADYKLADRHTQQHIKSAAYDQCECIPYFNKKHICKGCAQNMLVWKS